MIEILGIKLSLETVGFLVAFLASEVIGSSSLRENSIAQLAKSLIDTLKPSRKEDEKVSEVRKATELLAQTLRRLDDRG
jgi:hypothetical protein